MSLIDRDGRLFGRLNLIDAAVTSFVILLLPVGYATYLLFRPARPTIESVTRVEVTNEERRVSGAGILIAKLKVRGSGFNPLLRATVGSTPAQGFVFETPNSADVIVGPVPAGKYDLILFDGAQEVARARGAVEIHTSEGPWIRAYGWLTDLLPDRASTYEAGLATDPDTHGAFRIVTSGPVSPARTRIVVGTRATDLPLAGRVERAVELLLRCDWPSVRICTVGGESLREPPPISILLTGGVRFDIDAIESVADPTPVVITVRLPQPIAGMRVGERDTNIGTGAAEISAIAGTAVTLNLGAHQSREGWRYRGQLLVRGGTFSIRAGDYLLSGTVEHVRLASQ